MLMKKARWTGGLVHMWVGEVSEDRWTEYECTECTARVLGRGNDMDHGTELGKMAGIGRHGGVLRVNKR